MKQKIIGAVLLSFGGIVGVTATSSHVWRSLFISALAFSLMFLTYFYFAFRKHRADKDDVV
jgi:vacuolar-type H+-ATPase subunit I/STV1